MKKLLSILSIGTILGSSTPNLVSCNSKQASSFLSNLKVYNIGIGYNSGAKKIVIYPKYAFKTIETKIMQQYNNYNFSNKLSLDNFVAGDSSKLTGNKTWAIQIQDPISKTIIDPKKTTYDLVPPQKSNVLKNNALNVIVNTNESNVNAKNVIFPAYLNRFVYTNANLNKGNDIVPSNPSLWTKENVINAQTIKGITLPLLSHGLSTQTLITNILQNRALISKQIVVNFNNQLKNEINPLDGLGILKALDKNTFDIGSLNISLYGLTNQSVGKIPQSSTSKLPDTVGVKIFAGINFNRGLNNYIAFPSDYPPSCYLYLGATS